MSFLNWMAKQGGKRSDDLLICLTVGVWVVLLNHTSLFVSSEWIAFDQLTRLTASTRPLHPDLAVVLIDDDSIAALANDPATHWKWPWPRGAYADIITYLKASGAKEIWNDGFFTTPDEDSYQDDSLRATAAAAGNVYFGRTSKNPSLFEPTWSIEIQEESPVLRYDYTGQHLLAWSLPLRFQPKTFATPACKLVAYGHQMRHRLPPDDRLDPAQIARLWQDPSQVPDPALATRFKNKIVYIGSSAVGAYDLKTFPIGASEPGVMLPLTSRSNELQQSYFTTLPAIYSDLHVVIGCLLLGLAFLGLRTFSGLLCVWFCLIGVTLALTFALFLNHLWLGVTPQIAALLFSFMTTTAYNYIREGKRRRQVEEMFGKFLSKKMVDRLVSRPGELKLGGEQAEITVLFSDLSGFTTLSEQLSTEDLFRLLNTYLSEMSRKIILQDGYLDKYIGDAIMAFWGAPEATPDHAWQACFAALDCHKKLQQISTEFEKTYGVHLSARIGINTDEMMVGMIGSEQKHNYSVIGDAVNLASRMEGANKVFGTSIMISQRTLDLTQGKVEVRPIGPLQVKGKTRPIPMYELLARAGELSLAEKQAQTEFLTGYAHYLEQNWNRARYAFSQVLALLPGDGLSLYYLRKIEQYEFHPPGPDWKGVIKLDEK